MAYKKEAFFRRLEKIQRNRDAYCHLPHESGAREEWSGDPKRVQEVPGEYWAALAGDAFKD